MDLVTAAQMRAIEQTAINSGATTGGELMERAGRGVVDAIFKHRPDLVAERSEVVVLCGPGNNGGDGFVIARLLSEKGCDVRVYLCGNEEKLPPDAAENCRLWRVLGDVLPIEDLGVFDLLRGNARLVVDALFGTGMKRPLPGHIADLANAWGALDETAKWGFLVSVDVPSGLDSDSGRVIGDAAFRADLTVTFGWAKPAHFLAQGPALCGAVEVVSLGIEDAHAQNALTAPHGAKQVSTAIDRHLIRLAAVDRPHIKVPGHKYTHGHVLVLSGGVGKGGAARLAARGALRIGAGAVTVGAPPSALIENAAQLNAIMLQRINGPDGLAEVLRDHRLRVMVIGPGLSVGAETRALISTAFAADGPRAFVLDAGALASFCDAPEALFAMTSGTKTVLTPHTGEFQKLFPDISAQMIGAVTSGPAYSKVDATRAAAARAGCVVLLKGADTVISWPNGLALIVAAVRDRACPWLATAGAGDVLAGFIAGLLARGYDARQAAEEGAWLHQECARTFGPGLIAEDLAEELPKVLRALN
ncbi:MAG: NAD(P)H-hydrate dehydratase [Pikeienuella sp.]